MLAMKRQGRTIKEIGDELGYHPATISKWLQGRRAAAGADGRGGRSG